MNELKKIYNLHTIVKYESAVPRPKKEEYVALSESIRLRGQQEPIVCNSQGIILDGHTRFEICKDYGIEPKYIIRDFPSEEEEFQYVIESNLNRRQMNTWQKIMCYSSLIDYWQNRVREYRSKTATARNLEKIGEKIPYAQPVGSVAERFHKSLGIKIHEMEDALYIYKRKEKHPQYIKQLEEGTKSIGQVRNLIAGTVGTTGTGAGGIKTPYDKLWLECPSCHKVHTRDKFKKVVQPE